jgi:hypothetical protein
MAVKLDAQGFILDDRWPGLRMTKAQWVARKKDLEKKDEKAPAPKKAPKKSKPSTKKKTSVGKWRTRNRGFDTDQERLFKKMFLEIYNEGEIHKVRKSKRKLQEQIEKHIRAYANSRKNEILEDAGLGNKQTNKDKIVVHALVEDLQAKWS